MRPHFVVILAALSAAPLAAQATDSVTVIETVTRMQMSTINFEMPEQRSRLTMRHDTTRVDMIGGYAGGSYLLQFGLTGPRYMVQPGNRTILDVGAIVVDSAQVAAAAGVKNEKIGAGPTIQGHATVLYRMTVKQAAAGDMTFDTYVAPDLPSWRVPGQPAAIISATRGLGAVMRLEIRAPMPNGGGTVTNTTEYLTFTRQLPAADIFTLPADYTHQPAPTLTPKP